MRTDSWRIGKLQDICKYNDYSLYTSLSTKATRGTAIIVTNKHSKITLKGGVENQAFAAGNICVAKIAFHDKALKLICAYGPHTRAARDRFNNKLKKVTTGTRPWG